MSKTADMLFEYLRDILYNPENASLDPDKLDSDFQNLGKGLMYFHESLKQENDLSMNLAKGNLSVKLPPPDNQLAAPLKNLHASLKHLTWTSQQVAKGDYTQRLDFMGEFSEAFNTMTVQLEHRQNALEAEIEKSRRKTLALEQSFELLEAVTNRMQQWILVLDVDEGETLFQNKTATDAAKEYPVLSAMLRESLFARRAPGQETETEIELVRPSDKSTHYFSIVSYPVHWKDRSAVAFVITDVTDEKRHVQRLENYAYQDNLTGMSNRYLGMQTLRDWLDEKREFSMCFVDLDNLKFVNDNFGHSEGDIYIINAANILQKHLGEGLVCRLGGDEFMILAPGHSRQELEAEMEAARDALIQKGKAENKPYFNSLSYGVVQVEHGEDASSGALLSKADERMYQYKREHKMNRGKTLA